MERVGPEEKHFMDLLRLFFDMSRVIPCITFASAMKGKSRENRLQELKNFFVESGTCTPVVIADSLESSELDKIWEKVHTLPFTTMKSFDDLTAKEKEVAVQAVANLTPQTESSSSSCFPGRALVKSGEGKYHVMRDLLPGSDICSWDTEIYSQKGTFSKVLTYLDWKPDQVTDFLKLTTVNGEYIEISRDHLIFSKQDSKESSGFIQAKYIKLGDNLLNEHGVWLKVVSVETVSLRGAYAPLTYSGKLIVNGFCVSCYAHTPDHSIAHLAMLPLRVKHSLSGPDPALPEKAGIHPFAKFLMENFRAYYS